MIDYLRLNQLDDVLEMLWAEGPGVLLLAGGTDILVRPRPFAGTRILLDISRVEQLRDITVDPTDDSLLIGAAATHEEIAWNPLVSRRAQLLTQACRQVGSAQIRNLGTLGGNLGNASPAADSVPALACLEAQVVLSRRNQQRRLPVLEYFTGPGSSVRQPDEVISALRLPRQRGHQVSFFLKAGQRRGMCCSKASVAFRARRHSDGRLSNVRVALGAVSPTVVRVAEAEQVIEGRRLEPRLIEDAAVACSRAASPIDDIRSSADYRRTVVAALLKDGLYRLYDKQRQRRRSRRRRSK